MPKWILPAGLLGLPALALLIFTFTIGDGRLTGPGIFLSLSVLAMVVVAWLLFRAARALLPSGEGDAYEEQAAFGRRRKELEREYQALKRALKELELDHSMGKLSEADYSEIRGRYRERAMRILRQLDQGQDYRKLIELDLAARQAADRQRTAEPQRESLVPTVAAPVLDSTCAGCGTCNESDATFCKKCGARLARS